MDQLCLLPKYGASSSVVAFSILKDESSDESDEVKGIDRCSLQEAVKGQIQKKQEKKKDDSERNDNKDHGRYIQKFYQNE